jgi:tRNA 5-methylaminomethyl-2-thiouridine biosynthesis bifunctional protein
VGELGFGTGLNIVALLDAWVQSRPQDAILNVFSVEGFPLSRNDAARALSRWPELRPIIDLLIQRWPSGTPGFHRIDLPELQAVIDLAVGDAAWALEHWQGQADAWFLDGFAPSTNPAMWSDTVLDGVARCSAPNVRLATFTVAGSVRRGLAERGFIVEKRPGHGRKRERLEAHRTQSQDHTVRLPRVAVVGGGIAGAALARALAANGVAPIVLEQAGPGAGASGFPAALVTPRMDLGDADIAALFAEALERAGTLYRSIPDAVVAEGVTQYPGLERDIARFARIAQQPLWAPGTMTPAADGSLTMAGALTVQPGVILKAWLGEVELRTVAVTGLTPNGPGWTIQAATGETLDVDSVVVAAGWGVSALLQDLSITPVRGQADWISGHSARAEAWGGYIAPTPEGFLFGATHDRGEVATEVRAADTERNLATLAKRRPDLAETARRSTLHARAAVRATTRDRLPLAGVIAGHPGLFVLGGLGSRGFCLAPLLAEHVAALILDRPSPLPLSLARRVDPSRPTALAQPSEPRDG